MATAGRERFSRMRLARTRGVGAVGYRELLERHGSGEAACRALAAAGQAIADESMLWREIERVERLGGRHLQPGDADYPPLLAALADPPPLLVAVGDAALARRPVVAIVGARNASAAGRVLAGELAAAIGAAGHVVASGLARGIDGAAHRGAMATGTIGCVAGGIDVPYPPEHAALQREMGEKGLLLAEFPPGTEPQARHFPRRNRLIAGVARGVVVIEAAPGSGSLITARLAGEFGREVMAVPGHPSDPRSRGGNRLIRDGAALVETVEDILAVLSPFALFEKEGDGRGHAERHAAKRANRFARAAPDEARRDDGRADRSARSARGARGDQGGEEPGAGLIGLLAAEAVPVATLVRLSGLGAGEVQALLSEYEMEGRVIRLPGGRVALRR